MADPSDQMGSSKDGVRALGALIRHFRTAAQLTQSELGRRAGIVGKYVSEIERGTRDVPFSTLHAIAEDGLGLELEIRFHTGKSAAELPRSIAEIAQEIAMLAPEQRARVLSILRVVLKLAGR